MSTLSATALKAFRQCPRKFQLAYVEGLRPATATDALRIGSNWGELHGIYNNISYTLGPGSDRGITPILNHLNVRYQDIPKNTSPEDWEVEKLALFTCLMGYYEHWKDDPIAIQKTEAPFEFKIGSHTVLGKLDHIGTWQGRKCIIERKSTSRSLEPASEFWNVWKRDLQISLYYATVEPGTAILLDVWRKPTIKMTKKETPQTYAERLAGDIAERPEHYFARRELSRTGKEHHQFLEQLKNMERNISYMEKTGTFYENESACYDPYPCSYRSICHGSGVSSVRGGETPAGFIRLTTKGKLV